VQRDEPLAAGDIVQQNLRLTGGDDIDICVDDQPVERFQRVRRERDFSVVGVPHLDPPLSQHGHQMGSQITRPMMSVVTEKQQLEICGFQNRR
jgi:hypothetical protein